MMILLWIERNGKDLTKIFLWFLKTHCIVEIPEEEFKRKFIESSEKFIEEKFQIKGNTQSKINFENFIISLK